VLFEVVTHLSDGSDGVRRVGGALGPQVLKKSFNQAFGKLSDRMKVPRGGRPDLVAPRGFLGDLLDPTDWDTASLRSGGGFSDDEDETASLLLYQLEGQLEAPAFEHHRAAPSDDVSIAASDARDEDTDIVGEVNTMRRVGVVRLCCLEPYLTLAYLRGGQVVTPAQR